MAPSAGEWLHDRDLPRGRDLQWNAGNRALTPINGILFINLVRVTIFAISILSGYNMSTLEVTGAFITIAALVSKNLYQRKLIRTKNVEK